MDIDALGVSVSATFDGVRFVLVTCAPGATTQSSFTAVETLDNSWTLYTDITSNGGGDSYYFRTSGSVAVSCSINPWNTDTKLALKGGGGIWTSSMEGFQTINRVQLSTGGGFRVKAAMPLLISNGLSTLSSRISNSTGADFINAGVHIGILAGIVATAYTAQSADDPPSSRVVEAVERIEFQAIVLNSPTVAGVSVAWAASAALTILVLLPLQLWTSNRVLAFGHARHDNTGGSGSS